MACVKKMRMTPQRRVILEELRRVNDHPAADEIYHRVRKRLPKISLGTVYRNLEVLCELGEIQRLELSGSTKRYDGVPNKHYHIRCVECGRVDDAPIAPLTSSRTIFTEQRSTRLSVTILNSPGSARNAPGFGACGRKPVSPTTDL